MARKTIDELLAYHQEQAKKLAEKKKEEKYKKLYNYLHKNDKYIDVEFLQKVYDGIEKYVNSKKDKQKEKKEENLTS